MASREGDRRRKREIFAADSARPDASLLRTQIADVDVAVAQAAASTAMEGIDLDDDWQRTLRDVATSTRTADDLVAEEIERARQQ
ncbi:hypothetical protein [Amycolatopsis sp. cmx-11-51]|uniref:hypothetical protein n=1 Tax=Amycolatopsis sp. cmx-11-51 TaxID=2785797 RepID=UPI0039E26606